MSDVAQGAVVKARDRASRKRTMVAIIKIYDLPLEAE
jgi:hypothetical protein